MLALRLERRGPADARAAAASSVLARPWPRGTTWKVGVQAGRSGAEPGTQLSRGSVLEARLPSMTRAHPPQGAPSTSFKGSKGRVLGEAGVQVSHPEEEKSLPLSLQSRGQPGISTPLTLTLAFIL